MLIKSCKIHKHDNENMQGRVVSVSTLFIIIYIKF